MSPKAGAVPGNGLAAYHAYTYTHSLGSDLKALLENHPSKSECQGFFAFSLATVEYFPFTYTLVNRSLSVMLPKFF